MGGLAVKRILVLDGDSGKALDMARKVRELGVYSEIAALSSLDLELKRKPCAVIPAGVSEEVLQELEKTGIQIFTSGDLQAFLDEVCGPDRDWDMQRFLERAVLTFVPRSAQAGSFAD